MTLEIRLAVRDWDYMSPLALGEISSPRLDLKLFRVGTLPDSLSDDTPYNAFETSFSRHLSAVEAGNHKNTAIPNFLMRGFRHQCILTRKDSELTSIEDLRGKRIGVTGWRDSGNVWTRMILRSKGINTQDAYWYAGRLTDAHPIQNRLDGFGIPGLIEAMPDEEPMMESLARGWLDVVFTPFMPKGFFEASSQFRHLLPNLSASQADYFQTVGYVPGIHVLTMNSALLEEHPWAAQELSDLLDQSRDVWMQKRIRYADTTPFFMSDLIETASLLPSTWGDSGIEANRKMINDFINEMHDQAIIGRHFSIDEVFPVTK
nr:ABC transporter substrate-binding protein [uncultured Cohaesibacter sp.]